MSLERNLPFGKNLENKVLNTWVLNTTEAMRKPSGRDLSDYKEFLDFDEKELSGKTVLDLGSGMQERLAKGLKEAGIEAKVIALNPDYSLKKYRRMIHQQKDWQRKSLAGLAQALPFGDNTFDFILGLESVTMYEDAFEKPDSALAWAREIFRVLKPGGEARLAEILGLKNERRKNAWQKITRLLRKLGLEAKIETFKIKEKYPLPRYRLVIKKPNLQ